MNKLANIDVQVSVYLGEMEKQDGAVAGFLRELYFALPENERLEAAKKHFPEIKLAPANKCNNCEFDLGVAYENCGASEDGVCPECGTNHECAEASYDNRVAGNVPEEWDWEVKVCRTGYGFTTIEVQASTYEEAEAKALDEAGDHDYSEKSSEYTSDGARKL